MAQKSDGKVSKIQTCPLQAVEIERKLKPGHYADGNNLYLQVAASGSKSWSFRYWVSERDPVTGDFARLPNGKVKGRLREMGLGPYPMVSLSKARDEVLRLREDWKRKAVDPIQAARDAHVAAALARAKEKTFDEAAESFLAAHDKGWRSDKHRKQWRSSLTQYAGPVLGGTPVQMVDTDAVMRVLEPIWNTKTRTAARIRLRIEKVLDFATARGWRAQGPNPARWRGHLDKLLAKPNKVAKTKHHPMMDMSDMPAFMLALRKQEGVSAALLQFVIATNVRIGSAAKAQWREIDWKERVWTIPDDNLKVDGEDFRIPLNGIAMAALEEMRKRGGNDPDGFVFPGKSHKTRLSGVDQLRERMREARQWPDNRKGQTPVVHGFRATFKTWCEDHTEFGNGVVETAMLHKVGGKVEQSYMRGQLFSKRCELMQEWARHCG